jgi:hypothetical protein
MTSRTLFPVGSRVILQNLTKGTEFNGKVGVIKSKLTDERQQVLLIQSGKTLGIRPMNLKYEPRSVNSLSISELKTLLTLKEVTQLSGYDKSQLREMVKIKTESEEEVADLLYTHLEQENNQKASMGSNGNGRQQNGGSALNLSPDQMRQQAQMLRTMPASQIRRMNPQMAGFSDAQIQMAANQMEMMASNPEMLNQMKEQVKNMSPEELEQARMQAANGGAPGAGAGASGAPPAMSRPGPANAAKSMADMSPEQLKQQAAMMKNMTPDQLRNMNPAMANWSDAQINMAIQQMETMANNPSMMKQVSEQMKGMKPEEIEKMQKMAGEGFPDGSTGGAGAEGGIPQNPMDMLNNANPAQIKNMLNMVKENPKMMKDMLRSANPAMADKLTDEQIEKTIGAFANMDEKKIGWVLKLIGWGQEFKNSSKAKIIVFLFLSTGVFVFGMLVYLVRSQKGLEADVDVSLGSEEVTPVPVMDSEF